MSNKNLNHANLGSLRQITWDNTCTVHPLCSSETGHCKVSHSSSASQTSLYASLWKILWDMSSTVYSKSINRCQEYGKMKCWLGTGYPRNSYMGCICMHCAAEEMSMMLVVGHTKIPPRSLLTLTKVRQNFYWLIELLEQKVELCLTSQCLESDFHLCCYLSVHI